MSIIPILTPKHLLGILLKAGSRIIRQKGSHIWLTHPVTRKSTTIAMHAKDFSRRYDFEDLETSGDFCTRISSSTQEIKLRRAHAALGFI